MKTIKLIFDRTLEVLLSTLLLSMVFVSVWQIFTRHVLSNPASFTTEFVRFGLLWLSLLAAAYCFGKKAHLSIVFVKNKFRGKALLAIEIFTELTIIFFAIAVLIYGGIQGVIMGMGETSPTLYIPIGYIYMIFPLSGVFILFYSIINLMDHLREKEVNITEEVNQSTM